MLGHSQQSQQLDIRNTMALHFGFTSLEKFLNNVKKYSEAAAEMDRYIVNKTQDRIKDVVNDLDADVAMVSINSVDFGGKKKFKSTCCCVV